MPCHPECEASEVANQKTTDNMASDTPPNARFVIMNPSVNLDKSPRARLSLAFEILRLTPQIDIIEQPVCSTFLGRRGTSAESLIVYRIMRS